MDFEFSRQEKVIDDGGQIIQSTLNFDADLGTTSPMRSKEEANDYRYFPDPDLAPIHISDEWLTQLKFDMPDLPKEISKHLVQDYDVNVADATLIAEDHDMLAYFRAALAGVNNPKSLINWLTGSIRALLNEQNLTVAQFNVSPEQLADVINLVDDKMITPQVALQQLIPKLLKMQNNEEADVQRLAEDLNLLIVDNGDELMSFVDEVLSKYGQQVQAFKKGKKGVLGLFVGEVMKLAKGKANPQKINELIQEKLK